MAALTQIKTRDSNPKVKQLGDLDEATLFHRFLDVNVLVWVRAATAMIDYFAAQSDRPPWLEYAKKMLGIRTKQPTTNQNKKAKPPRGG